MINSSLRNIAKPIFLSWMPVLLLYETKYLSWSSKLYVAQHIENGCGLLILLILEVLLMDTRVPIV